MKKQYKKAIILTFTILLFVKANAQKNENNFYIEIKNYDLSKIITTDTIIAEDREKNKEKILKAEPIGFIGDDFQRFYIHVISVIQNPKNQYEYFVYGKTKVKETIRPFQGTLTIKKADIEKNTQLTNYQQGTATCEVNFYEDKKLTSTGFINGVLTIDYLIDPKKNFRYDALNFYSDRFSNNTFTGTWTSYKTNVSKKCNWGDYRIPNSGDLDIGAGEFSPNPKYFDKGWKYYILTQSGETEVDVEMGKNKEKIKWWK
jgi:hypothetical protein